jgi:hypothetical protein
VTRLKHATAIFVATILLLGIAPPVPTTTTVRIKALHAKWIVHSSNVVQILVADNDRDARERFVVAAPRVSDECHQIFKIV